jgi:chemotaxis protein methyltransferase CheR
MHIIHIAVDRGLMNEYLSRITKLLNKKYGKDVSVYDEAFLSRTIEKRWVAVEATNADKYYDYLKGNSQEAHDLMRSFQINFTQFFRDTMTFAYLEQDILPSIVFNKTNGNEIRVWSAGCSSGQEPYSLAMLLSDINETSEKEIRFRIFATDISAEALDKAREGIYDESAIQNVKKKHLDKYFIKLGKKYKIIPELKRHIEFSIYDLSDPSTASPPGSIFGDFDVIMCSNVCIYYKGEFSELIIKKIQNAVSDDGYFVTSEAEKSLFQSAFNKKTTVAHIPIFRNNTRR